MGYRRLQGVTGSYEGIEGIKGGVTRRYRGLQELQGVTGGLKGFSGDTTGYNWLPTVIRGYRGLQGVT